MLIEVKEVEFNNWLKAKGLKARTLFEYNKYFKVIDLTMFSSQYLLAFLASYKNNGIVRAFINNMLEYIKTSDFPEEVKKEILGFKLPKQTGRKKKMLPDCCSIQEIHDVAKRGMTCTRNKLACLISFYGGLRVSELVGYDFDPINMDGIKVDDFNWNTWKQDPTQDGRLRVIGKGLKQRNVFVPSWLMRMLFHWIKNEVSAKQTKDEKLFSFGESRWKKILYAASLRTIGRKIHPHTLRHSCASWLKENGWSDIEIRDYLGHDSVVTTQGYEHVSQVTIKRKFSEATQSSDERN